MLLSGLPYVRRYAIPGALSAVAQESSNQLTELAGDLTALSDTVAAKATAIDSVQAGLASVTAAGLRENPKFASASLLLPDYGVTYGWPTSTMGALDPSGAVVSPGWAVAASSAQEPAFEAFSTNPSRFGWLSDPVFTGSGATGHAWIQLMYPEPVALVHFTLGAASRLVSDGSQRMPATWTMQCSDDGATWTTVAQYDLPPLWADGPPGTRYTLVLPVQVQARVWRMDITKSTGQPTVLLDDVRFVTAAPDTVALDPEALIGALTIPGSLVAEYFTSKFVEQAAEVRILNCSVEPTGWRVTTDNPYGDLHLQVTPARTPLHVKENPHFKDNNTTLDEVAPESAWWVDKGYPSGWAANASSQFDSSWAAFLAHDKDPGNNWDAWHSASAPPQWLSLQFPTPVRLMRYSLRTIDQDHVWFPQTWYVQGSTNGVNWTSLEPQRSVSTWSRNTVRIYTLQPGENDFYSFFRVFILHSRQYENGSGSSDFVAIAEWRLYVETPVRVEATFAGARPDDTQAFHLDLVDAKQKPVNPSLNAALRSGTWQFFIQMVRDRHLVHSSHYSFDAGGCTKLS